MEFQRWPRTPRPLFKNAGLPGQPLGGAILNRPARGPAGRPTARRRRFYARTHTHERTHTMPRICFCREVLLVRNVFRLGAARFGRPVNKKASGTLQCRGLFLREPLLKQSLCAPETRRVSGRPWSHASSTNSHSRHPGGTDPWRPVPGFGIRTNRTIDFGNAQIRMMSFYSQHENCCFSAPILGTPHWTSLSIQTSTTCPASDPAIGKRHRS